MVLLSVQYLKISSSSRNHSHLVETWTSILVCPSSTINLPAGVRSLLSIMGGAIVSPQTIPGVEGLLTVSTRIFLYRLLNRKFKNCFLLPGFFFLYSHKFIIFTQVIIEQYFYF